MSTSHPASDDASRAAPASPSEEPRAAAPRVDVRRVEGPHVPASRVEASRVAVPRAAMPRDAGEPAASDLLRYLLVLRKRWPLIVAVCAVVVVAVGLGTALQTPVYRATGLIELRGQSGDGVSVEELFQAQRLSTQFLETQYGVLRSPAVAQRAMLAVGLLDPAAAGAADSAPVVAERTTAFAAGLIVDPVDGSNLVRVHYEAGDPRLAARVVNAVLASYTAMRAEVARGAVAQLATEVDSVRGRLAQSERQLLAYARRNGLVAKIRGGDAEELPHARLRVLQQQLAEADADRYGKESLYDLVRAPGDGLLESEILQALHVRLATLRSEHAKLRATFLDDYPRTRELSAQIGEVETLLARERGRLRGAIASRYQAAVRRQELLQRAVDEQRALVDGLGERAAQYGILARDVEAQQGLYAKLQERLRAAEVSAAVATTDVSVIQAAVTPAAPVRPDVTGNLTLALVVGLALGVGAAFARDQVDATVRNADDLQPLPVPLLGLIPSAPLTAATSERKGGRRLGGRLALPRAASAADLAFEQDALMEAFLSLRTAILMAGDAPASARSLVITSARPGDGKTTIAANLAMALARLDRRVLLVDADMRRPAVHRAFSLPRGAGLSECLRGETRWTSVVQRAVAPGLDLLLAGERLGASTELLASERTVELLDAAREAYDCVLVDSPALGINAADTRILSPLVDAVLLVVRSGSTPRALLAPLLRQTSNVVGVVLNGVDPRDFPAYYYAYGRELEHATTV